MSVTRPDVVIQFTKGSGVVWSDVTVPPPLGSVIIDTLNKIIKEGDGTTLFSNLPTCLNYNFGSSSSGAILPTAEKLGEIVVSKGSLYSPSGIRLTDILNSITNMNTTVTSRQGVINSLNAGLIVGSVTPGIVDGTIVVCNNGMYVPGSETLAQLISNMIASSKTNGIATHITDLIFYSDSALLNPITSSNDLNNSTTYYCKVTGWHDTAELRAVNFNLSTATPNIAITNNQPTTACNVILDVYGGTGVSYTNAIITDSSNNIYCVGYTSAAGAGGNDAFITKFDANFTVLASKVCGGTGDDAFLGVAIDSIDSIICVGYTASTGAGGYDGLIVKFDTNLGVTIRKTYGGTGTDKLFSVITDSSNHIICVGDTTSAGAGNSDALIVKFDTNFNVLAAKVYGGTSSDHFTSGTIDSSGNYICVGYTNSIGAGNNDGLIVKFDTSLNVLLQKIYGGTGDDYFNSVAIGLSGSIIVVGQTSSAGAGGIDALIVKFNTSLSVIGASVYGGGNADYFQDVAISSSGNYLCVGNTYSSGVGNNDALFVEFDINLTVIYQNTCGSTNYENFNGVTTDSSGNVYCAGSTTSGGNKCLAAKFPPAMPVGTFSGTVLTTLILKTPTLTLTPISLTSAASTLILVASSLTLAMSSLTVGEGTALTATNDTVAATTSLLPTNVITTVYSSSGTDQFVGVFVDVSENIIAVGSTTIAGVSVGLISKLDSNFNVLSQKTLSGGYSSIINSVVTDSAGNLIVVGSFNLALNGNNTAFIAKIDPTVTTVIGKKTVGGSGDQMFYDVCVGASGNYVAVGYTTSAGAGGKDALIVKFSSSDLSVLVQECYGGMGDEILYSVAADTLGDFYCAGSTASEGTTPSGLILKADSGLNILARKIYTSSAGTATTFMSVAVTAANVFCAGYVTISAGNKGLVVKLDTSLNVSTKVLYGNTTGATQFTGVSVDKNGNVICAGKTGSDGVGGNDALVLKLTNALTTVGCKTYGTINSDCDIDVTTINSGDMIVVGFCTISGSIDAIVTKIPSSIPSGTYTNKYFSGLAISDALLTLSADTATTANSALSLVTSTLTVAAGSMTFSGATGSTTTDSTIVNAISNVFKVVVGVVTSGNPVVSTFNAATNDGNVMTNKNMTVNIHGARSMLEGVYGITPDDSYYNGFFAGAISSDGFIYAVGTVTVAAAQTALIVKFDSNLNILAQKTYGDAGGSTTFLGVAIDSSRNVYAAGYLLPNSGAASVMIVKYDSNLNVLIAKTYGTIGFTSIGDYGGSISLTTGGLIFSGSAKIGTNTDCLIMKLDTSLNLISQYVYGAAVSGGGPG